MSEQPRELPRCGWCLALGHTTADCPAGRSLLGDRRRQSRRDPVDTERARRDAENPL